MCFYRWFATDWELLSSSWQLIATALSDASGLRSTSSAVIQFLADDYVHGLLKDPSSAFAPASESSKANFETKTAPINVPSGPDGKCDIETIKKDAEWLSKNAKINLVAALRVVVVEYQSRPSRHLVGPLSSQDATNLQEAAGLHNGQGAAFISDLGASAALDADEIWTEFEKPESKQRRLFHVFLTERRYFMMAADYAHSIKLYGRLPTFAKVDLNLEDVYRLKKPSRDDLESLLPAYLQVLTDAMTQIEGGLQSITDESWVTQEIELDWLRTLLTEAAHSLSIVFQVVDTFGDDFAPSSSISQWFSLMEMYGFFDALQPVCLPLSLKLCLSLTL